MYIRAHIKASIQIKQHLRQNGSRCRQNGQGSADAVDERRCQGSEKGCKTKEAAAHHESDLEGDEGQA